MMKVSALAKELEMTSKELIEKATSMGIEAKTGNSNLAEIDAKTIKNSILAKRKKEAETRIVRANPQSLEGDKGSEPKVTLKAANIKSKTPPTKAGTPKSSTMGNATKPPVTRPPMGNPLPKKSTAPGTPKPKAEGSKASIPVPGTPLPKAEVIKKAVPGTPLAKSEKIEEKENPSKIIAKADVPENKQLAEINEEQGNKVSVSEKVTGKKVNSDKASDKKITSDVKKETNSKEGESKKKEIRDDRVSIDRTSTDRTSTDRAGRGNSGNRPISDKGANNNRSASDRPYSGSKPTSDRSYSGSKPTTDRGNSGKKTVAPAAGSHKSGEKPNATSRKGDRDKNKHNKADAKGGRKEPRSLEKKARKKHVKPKIAPVPEVEVAPLPVGTKVINVPITIAGFCEQTGVTVANVILTLLKMGVVANQNQNIDEVTVATLADEMGIQVVIGSVEEEEIEEGLELFEDREKDLQPRSPIITVMGHVDHGKTSLLDAIRKTNVTAGESGGITQHIGASEVEINGEKIVFLDTPGHEAFTAMRARGADITDIAILVVAADDSVKPQTIESISHAKAAGVPIIVAMNKIDKPGANPEKVKQDLTEHGIVVEEYGGDVISVPVSAKTGEGIVNLLEMILIQAEVLELKANPNRHAMGTVIEARLDKSKGPVASLLITNGTLKTGQSIVAGTSAGRIRLMSNHKGETIPKAGPARAVEVLGLTEVPAAGDKFNAVGEDKLAKDIAEKRRLKQRDEVMARTSSSSLEELFSQMEEGEVKELNLIVKADVRGSIGAIMGSLEKLSNEHVKVRILHSGVGAITESDVALAGTSGAIIIGFNVRPSVVVAGIADREGVQIRTYRVIYDIIDDIENAMTGMLDPEFKEEVLGQVEVRNTFKVPGIGIIAGAYVTNGKMVRNSQIRLVRDGIVIHEGTISSLKRFKDDAKEVAQGYECGIGIANYNDIKEGDVIECFHMVEIERA